jgi:hypothetical protein
MRSANRLVSAVFLILSAGSTLPALADDLPLPPVLPTPPSEEASTVSGAAPAGEPLLGMFDISEGACSGGPVTAGSFFRMFDPGGGLVTNGSSPCGDKTFTPLSPGSDGGLSTTGFQPHPDPAFDGAGNGTNDKVTRPQPFYGTRFSTATNQKDPQTGVEVGPPKLVTDESGNLSGDLRAFSAAWQNQHFNQGAPKPDGSAPGQTAAPAGTLDHADGSYTLEWKSHIVGGPFDNFTGFWHLEGTFRAGETAPSQAGAVSSAGTAPGAVARSGGLASTGPPFSTALGLALLGAACLLLAFDAAVARWRKTR